MNHSDLRPLTSPPPVEDKSGYVEVDRCSRPVHPQPAQPQACPQGWVSESRGGAIDPVASLSLAATSTEHGEGRHFRPWNRDEIAPLSVPPPFVLWAALRTSRPLSLQYFPILFQHFPLFFQHFPSFPALSPSFIPPLFFPTFSPLFFRRVLVSPSPVVLDVVVAAAGQSLRDLRPFVVVDSVLSDKNVLLRSTKDPGAENQQADRSRKRRQAPPTFN